MKALLPVLAIAAAASAASAQERVSLPRTTVRFVDLYPREGTPVRRAWVRAGVSWLFCDEVAGDLPGDRELVVADVDVRSTPPRAWPRRCSIRRVGDEPTSTSTVFLTPGATARLQGALGPFVAGASRGEVARIASVRPDQVPESGWWRHGPYHVSMWNGRVRWVGAFADELGELAVDGEPALATREAIAAAYARRTDFEMAVGSVDAAGPQLSREQRALLARLGFRFLPPGSAGWMPVGDRWIVFASAHQMGTMTRTDLRQFLVEALVRGDIRP
jgi:hypothetical protein